MVFTDNKKSTMNKRINFEDTVFILNVRLRMVKDSLLLDTDSAYFYSQTMADLEFTGSVLDMLTEKFVANLNFLDRETEGDNILDIEWNLSQILNEISNNSGPFPPSKFPEMPALITKFRNDSARRQSLIEESYVTAGQSAAEPVVSTAELNGLLGSE